MQDGESRRTTFVFNTECLEREDAYYSLLPRNDDQQQLLATFVRRTNYMYCLRDLCVEYGGALASVGACHSAESICAVSAVAEGTTLGQTWRHVTVGQRHLLLYPHHRQWTFTSSMI